MNFEHRETKVSEKVQRLVAAIKEKTAMPAYKVSIIKDSIPGIFDSKFGGVPYWDLSKEYPVNSQGEKLMLLAQFNFTKEALGDERLPQSGMLQFFIGKEDVFGIDFDDPDSQNDFRVVYHETIDNTVTKEQIEQLAIPVATDEENEEYSPVFREAAVQIEKEVSYMGTEDVNFETVFAEVAKKLDRDYVDGQSYWDYLNDNEDDENYFCGELGSTGHWILGYPFFTQSDIRESLDDKEAAYYNTLLFQMDSEAIDGEDYILWGDCGVGNFFINDVALKNKDFSKVVYNWDCY